MAEPEELPFDDPSTFGDNPADFIAKSRRSATASALGDLDADPEQAARANEISRSTGLPAPVVYGDQDHYEQQHKAALTGEMLDRNQFLRSYVQNDPMAAKLSNDDWGQLDSVSDKLDKQGFKGTPIIRAPSSIASEFLKGFKEKFTEEPIGQWMLRTPSDVEWVARNPYSASLLALEGLPFEIGAKVFSSGLEGLSRALVQGYQEFGGTEQGGKQFARDITGMAEYSLIGAHAELHAAHIAPEVVDKIQANRLMNYIVRGEEPPVGISPMYDQLKIEEAKQGMKKFDEITKDAQASSTRERDPETFSGFVRQQTGEATIGIDPHAVRQLYGDKVPEAGDNLLGYVKDLPEQLEIAERTGADIQVPMADWLAHTDPEVAKQLHDFTRVKPSNMTLEETKVVKEMNDLPQPMSSGEPAVDAIRSQAALEPMFDAERAQKVKLERSLEATTEVAPTEEGVEHHFTLNSTDGNRVGEMSVSEIKSGKELYVNWLGAQEGPSALGPRAIRDLLAQIKQEFPNAEKISGFRASGARFTTGLGADVSISIKDIASLPDGELAKLGQSLVPEIFGEIVDYSNKTKAVIVPRELYTENQRALSREVEATVERLMPKGVSLQEAHEIRREVGGKRWTAGAVYMQYANKNPLLLWSLTAEDPLGTMRHEAIHHLRGWNFIEPNEWKVLEQAAKDMNWLDVHDIKERYGHLNPEAQLEEAIAEGFRYWSRGETKLPGVVEQVFQKIKELLDAVKDTVRRVLGKEPTYDQLFREIESGKIGEREGRQPTTEEILAKGKGPKDILEGEEPPTTKMKQIELPQAGTTPMAERSPFEHAAAVGMTKDQYRRYEALIDKRNAEDAAKQLDKVQDRERIRQSREWKENSAEMRKETEQEVLQRPDIAADTYFRKGTYLGERIQGRIPKLDRSLLTPEQRKAIPEDYQAKPGPNVHNPDDAAQLFGFQSGDALVGRLAQLEQFKKDSGLEGKPFVDKLIDDVNERKMEQKYGKLQENIIQEAKDQVLSKTQLDIIHEDVLALASKNMKAEISLSREVMEEQIIKQFNGTAIGMLKSADFLRSAGKAGKAAELSLLKNDPSEAFRQKQVQFNAMVAAKQAIKLEKETTRFDKLADTYSKRGKPGDLVSGTAQEYTNFIHEVLMRIDKPVKRSLTDLIGEIQREGYKNIVDFRDSKAGTTFGMNDLPISELLLDQTWRKPYDSLTVDEFREIRDSVVALSTLGKEERKVTIAGEKVDRAEYVDKMIENVETFPLKKFTATPTLGQKVTDLPRAFLAKSTALETLFNRFDRNDPRGSFNKLMYTLTTAANYKNVLQREFAKSFSELPKLKGMNKLVDSPLIDPLSISKGNPDGSPMTNFTMGNVLVMIHNMGNEHNWNTFARGWGQNPEVLKQWVFAHSTKEMFDYAQKMGAIFKNAFEKAQTTYHNIYGVAPEKIDLQPFDTPFGKYDGWYHPLIKDPQRDAFIDAEGNKVSGQSTKQKGGTVYDDPDNFHARTTNGYTKKRTGAVYPVDLNPDMIPVRLGQMIHDIAFRDPIIQAEKIFKDERLQNAITKHYGKIYSEGLMDYLRGIAGEEGIPSKAMAKANQWSEYMRQNVISTYIGFNIFTALKHGPTALMLSAKEVGTVNFLNAMKDLYRRSEDINLSNKEFVDKWSEEVGRRKRHWQDTISGQYKDIYGKGTWREKIIEAGSWLVAQSDMASVRPTWLGAYRDAIKEGSDHGEAVQLGERAVRRAHGSTAVTNQPALVRGGGPLHSWLTSIYGFFGTVMQRRIEFAHVVNDTYKLGREGELKEAAGTVPDILGRTWAHFIWPILVEEYVTGLTTDDKRGWGQIALSATTHGLGASALYIRDLMHAWTTGHDPGVGLISSPMHDATKLINDMKKGQKALSKQQAGKTVQDFLTVFGEFTGRASKEVGNLSRFGIDMMNKQQRPRTPGDWFRGLTRGDIKPRKVK